MTYEEFVINYIQEEAKKAGSIRKLAEKKNVNPGMFSRVINGNYILKPKTFLKHFPEANIPDDLKYDVKNTIVNIKIECEEFEVVKEQLSKLGYTVEIVLKKIEP